MSSTPDTRTRLIVAASELFRIKGYHGVGIAEVLAQANAPKGSLYHHFPNGKPDLAIAAADWASQGMLQIINDSFADADSFEGGATTLCHKLAKFFDISDQWDGCPVSHVLFDGPGNDAFRQRSNTIFDTWIGAVAAHGIRLGKAPEAATEAAETLLIAIQGSWVMARARRSSDMIRAIPSRLYRENA